MGGMGLLEVRHLTKTFKSGKGLLKAVDNVTFSVSQGEIVGLLGPNGAGKTTTIKSVLGIMRPDSGDIRVAGFDPFTRSKETLSRTAAVLEGSRNIYWRMSAWENIVFFAGIHGISEKQGRSYFGHLIETFRLTDKRNTEVRLMSQGMKQKVAICCALAKQTPLVFLDEPTLGLDVETSYELRGALKALAASEGRTLVISSHDMDVIENICHRVLIMSGGRLIADERINDLLALFRTRTYKLVVSGAAPLALLEFLQQHFHAPEILVSERQTVIQVDLQSTGEFYELIDGLREHGVELETINQQEPDLEKAFLTLVRKERERCNGTLQH